MEHFIREQYKCSLLAFYIKDNLVSARVFMDDEGFYEDAATGSANGDLVA
jgi:predicted PhzF superfamily epimerase YddE/YHI9